MGKKKKYGKITWTSKVKYFFKFLMIMTRKGSLMPNVFFGSAGQEMKVVLTFVPTISNTRDWMSLSVIRLMWPLRTFLSHICRGLLPILYRMDKNPLWNVFLNIFAWFSGSNASKVNTQLSPLAENFDFCRYPVSKRLFCKQTSFYNISTRVARRAIYPITAKF